MAKGLLTDEEELRRFNAIEAQAQPWYARALPMEGRATFLPFRDTMPGSVFNKRELAVPGLIAEVANAITAPARSLLGTDPEFEAGKEGVNMAMNVMGGGVGSSRAMANPTGQGGIDLALNAWHGTPHNIQGKFDISKVGTGEGAQAYGHGIYFAENPSVATRYRDTLTNFNAEHIKNKLIDSGISAEMSSAYADFASKTFGKNLSFDNFIKIINEKSESPYIEKYRQNLRKEIPKTESAIKNITGNLYKVDIPDEQIPKMLDWDKPLSQQPKEIQNWLSDPYNPYKKQLLEKDSGGNEPYGRDIYNRLANLMSEGKGWDVGNKNASQELSSFGIAGIRYLDEGSRANGKGTSNFVVFKPETVKILEKNDIPIEKLLEEGLLGN